MAVHVRVGDDRVGTIELDRPERRNALNVETCEGIVAAVEQVRAERARAVVVTGSGTSFCSGADFGEVYGEHFTTALYAALQAVFTLPVPVVAAVNGPAIGGGTQLAIACDLRVAAEGARFAVPTARLGVAVDPWTIRRLEQLAGGALARSVLIGCETVGPELAHARGLVDRLGSPADAHAWAAELAGLAPLTLAYNKQVLDRVDLPASDPVLTGAFAACWSSADLAEGRAARAEKRAPAFEGR
ncbi:enoyl-CoA hydratase [Pseudonocardia oroxyli]|uniref:Enoyl-CoA hydratase n=1 Tax=Pseudonocardia oroxyli TaxID=366584 RepID=A0A1G7HN72_PSEOR|nr:enoyl-CoA hydratase [Pseudonocardia oroxyli]SDF01654.1 enoyl-CoA hydratase [Pseudonocardia oroxyli]